MIPACKRILSAMAALALLSGAPSLARAEIGKSLESADKGALTIRAEDLTYFSSEHLFVAEGDVEITYGEAHLTADYVEFHELTGDALAIGHVVYEEGVESMTADRASMNIDKETGTISVGKLSLADDQFFTGREILKTGEKTYTIKHGTFTACDSSRPAWLFRSSTANVEQDQYLQAWNTVGYIKGIPVFYFPYIVFPIKRDRQSGFLIPEVSNSTINGFRISNAYFWAITDSQDATLRHTYYDLRGNEFGLEYRYKYSKKTDGTLLVDYFYKDRKDSQSKTRVDFSHRQALPFDVKGRVNIDYTDNDQFDKDFSTVLDDRSDTYLESDISLTRNFSQHTLKLLFDRLDDLREDSDDRQDQKMPEFSITSQNQQIFGTPLYIRQETKAARLRREGKPEEFLEMNRLDIHPTLSMPINWGNALTVTPKFTFRETYYSEFTTKEKVSESSEEYQKKTHDADSREYYTAELDLSGPRFQRIFDRGNARQTQKIKHLIEPSFSYKYLPGIDESDLPKFDGTDRIGSEKQSRMLSYSLTQRLLTKRVKQKDWERFLHDEEGEIAQEDLATETAEMASFVLSQSYNLELDEHQFSDISATLNLEPWKDYDVKVTATYNPYVSSFVSTMVDLEGEMWDAWEFDVRWRRTATVDSEKEEITDVSQFIDMDTSLLLFERLKLSYRGRFDVTEGDRIEDNIGLIYNGQCWNFSTNFVQQLVDDEIDTGFRILLELKHLGKLLDLRG